MSMRGKDLNGTTGQARAAILAVIMATALAGCGGGGGGSGGTISTPSTIPAGGTITPPTTPTPAPNQAPTIGGSPATTLAEGSAYAFQPSASDPDGDALAFSASGLPAWLTINSSTGQLSGTAPAGSAGSYGGIVVTVSDGKASASLPALTIVVAGTGPTPPPPPTNTPPTISGTPVATVTPGQAYVFQAVASDPDNQTLRFGIANKPAWATFDIVTGRLSGTPAATDAGTYANVVISVSDGTASATLPAFSIVVMAPVSGIAELTWTAPTQNEDGTALTNLAGYKLRYGQSPSALTQVLDIPAAGTTSARVEGLTSGTWYFTLASYTNNGVESVPTGAVSKTIT